MSQPSALTALTQLILERGSGVLRSNSGLELHLRAGQVIGLRGAALLKDSFPKPASGWTGNLESDLGLVMATGADPQSVFQAAGLGLGKLLRHLWEEGDQLVLTPMPVISGGFPLPGKLARHIAPALKGMDLPDSSALMHQTALGTRQVKGLAPMELRTLQMAEQDASVSHCMSRLSQGSSERWEEVGRAINLLRVLGLIQLEEPEVTELPALSEGGLSEHADLIALLDQEDHILLGLDKDEALPSAQSVQEGLVRFMSRYHPDRYPHESQEFMDLLDQVIERGQAAFQNLRKSPVLEELRKRLDLERRGEIYVSEVDASRAKSCFNRAQSSAQKGSWDRVMEHLQECLEADPRHLEAQILLCLARVMLGESSPEEGLKALEEMEIERIRDRIEHEYVRGLLFKRMEQHDRAKKSFRKVLELKPEHHQAKREIWLYERREKKDEEKSRSGVFRSLFRRG